MAGYFMGLDGRGTRTRAVLYDTDLVVAGQGTAGPSDAFRGSLAHVMEVVHEAIAADAELAVG